MSLAADPPPSEASVWRPADRSTPTLPCGGTHSEGGRLDESARRLSHEEYAVARLLAGEGHEVRAQPESRRGGRRADLSVCGTPVEVKSFASVDERSREPGARSVFNKLADAAGQARHVVLVDRGSGLSPGAVRQGLARWALRRSSEASLDSVRVVGAGYDLAWARVPGRRTERSPSPRSTDRGRSPGREP